MGSAVRKNALREIRGTFGRFFAIMAIIALGVGFFTGVRIVTPAMVNTVNKFLDENQFYDYRLLSSIGWEEEDVEDFISRPEVRYAEGSYTLDILTAGSREYVLRAHSLTDNINGIRLKEGRLPQNENECVIENGKFKIGGTITLSEDNSDSTISIFPASIFEKSRMSLMIFNSVSPERLMLFASSLTLGSLVSLSMISLSPRMEFTGVRISWDMWATNMVFASFLAFSISRTLFIWSSAFFAESI